MAARYVFTLVHGTKPLGSLQKTPEWIDPQSAFSRTLCESFGGQREAETHPFEWSGWNTVGSREKAAEKLGAELNRRIDESPADARHFLVCHSHGGNVALYTLARDPKLRERVAGVACLATPFLSARNRQLGWSSTEVATGLIAVLFLTATFLIVRFFNWFAAIASVLVASTGVEVLRWLRRGLERLKDGLQTAPLQGDRLLIVRSPADEASLFLAFFQFVSWLTVKVFLLAQSGYAWTYSVAAAAARHKWRVALVLACVFASIFGFLIVNAVYAESHPTLALAARGGIAAAFIVFSLSFYLLLPRIGLEMATFPFRVAVMFLTWPIIILLSMILLVPFGPRGAIANIFLEISAESTPPGDWLVHLIEPPPPDDRSAQGEVPLRHSIYDNPEAMKHLVEWARKLAGL